MANTVKNTSVGKPKVGGSIYVAPSGTALPTDADSALGTGFKCMGYISDDGVQNDWKKDQEVKAWGGDQVIRTMTDTFKATLIEVLNEDVLSVVYGSGNVSSETSTDGDTKTITVQANEDVCEEVVVVIETILRGNTAHRIVLPRAQVTEVGTVTYKDSDAVGYETTFTANLDDSGNTHYEYTKVATA